MWLFISFFSCFPAQDPNADSRVIDRSHFWSTSLITGFIWGAWHIPGNLPKKREERRGESERERERDQGERRETERRAGICWLVLNVFFSQQFLVVTTTLITQLSVLPSSLSGM